MAQVNCPRCDEAISSNATKCPRCQSDLRKKALGQKILDLRDYVTFPTAVIALVVALFSPINLTIRRMLCLDGASVSGHVFTVDTINVGLDDTKLSQQVETVKETVFILRGIMTNSGYSSAAIQSAFKCFGKRENNVQYVYSFTMHDPKQQLKQFPDIAPGSEYSVIGRFGSAEPDRSKVAPAANTCEFGIVDKYGPRRVRLKARDDLLPIFGKAG
jgi:hypothetical protein